jgi:hypothetical protein
MRLERESIFGEYLGTRIRLTAVERAALLRASQIAAEMRELARSVDPGYEDDSIDTLLAEIEHNARDFADESEIARVDERIAAQREP